MKTPDILLIDPPWNILSPHNIWKNIGSCLPSLGLAYVASSLEKHGFTVRIVDCTADKRDLDSLVRLFSGMTPPRFVGLTATTPLIKSALLIAEAAKNSFPGAVVVLGGVHPTVLPEEVLSHPAVDIVVRGEGEETMLELARGKALSGVAGISYKENGALRHNPDRPLIKDIDTVPPPAYHLLPMKNYYPALGSYRRLPAMSIFATRGCPGRCTFCHRTFYGKIRKRSAANIVEEVELLSRRYGIREIAFYDDAFTAFKDVVLEFCRLLEERKLKITWSCFTRADLVNRALLAAMKKAGCHLILFGVESADETILKN
ncbi:MAG: B12-binding domain-containing radical SAM protein, partial [Endomicrobiales bacterium]